MPNNQYEVWMETLDCSKGEEWLTRKGISQRLDYYKDPKLLANHSLRYKTIHQQTFSLLPLDHMLEIQVIKNQVPKDTGIDLAVDLDYYYLKTALEALKILKDQTELVAFNITGPVSVLESVAGHKYMRKLLRRPSQYQDQIDKLIYGITSIGKMALEAGADVISYFDPTGVYELLGPRWFGVSAGWNLTILSNLEKSLKPSGQIIFTHPMLSRSMAKVGFVELIKLNSNGKFPANLKGELDGESTCLTLTRSHRLNKISFNEREDSR